MNLHDEQLKKTILDDQGTHLPTDFVNRVMAGLENPPVHLAPVLVHQQSSLLGGDRMRLKITGAVFLLTLMTAVFLLVGHGRHTDDDLHHVDTLSLSTLLLL